MYAVVVAFLVVTGPSQAPHVDRQPMCRSAARVCCPGHARPYGFPYSRGTIVHGYPYLPRYDYRRLFDYPWHSAPCRSRARVGFPDVRRPAEESGRVWRKAEGGSSRFPQPASGGR